MAADDLTRLLREAAAGATDANERLLPAVYEQLRAMARRQLLDDAATIEPTALVHEAWLRLSTSPTLDWNHRGHFFGAAAQAMRRILVDHARARGAVKRGGGASARTLVDVPQQAFDLAAVLDVDAALTRLEAGHPREARIVLMRYFAGFTCEEVAASLDVSLGTVERDWRIARARLQRWLDEPNAG